MIGGIRLNSEFYTVTSTSTTDFRPLDFRGAREVVLMLDKSVAGGLGFITNEPFAGSPQFPIYRTDDMPPLVVHSSDDRLYFVAGAEAETVLYVWVVR